MSEGLFKEFSGTIPTIWSARGAENTLEREREIKEERIRKKMRGFSMSFWDIKAP